MDRCYACHTTDFETGQFADITSELGTYGPSTVNVFCLGCAAKYEAAGAAEFRIIPTYEQVSTWIEWQMAGIDAN